jgi:hypothetical protein
MSQKPMKLELFDGAVVIISRILAQHELEPKRPKPIIPSISDDLKLLLEERFCGVEPGESHTASVQNVDDFILITQREIDTITLECAIVLHDAGAVGVHMNEHLVALRIWILSFIEKNFECNNIHELQASPARFGLNETWAELARKVGLSEREIEKFQARERANFPNGYPDQSE